MSINNGDKKMERNFNKNMFVMLLSIMAGAIIITYFIADLTGRTEWEKKEKGYKKDIVAIKDQSENFTSHFLKSTVILDQAREYRAFGDYHFDLAFLWYNSALSEKNSSLMELYKERGTDNCTNAMPHYLNSYLNFEDAKIYFFDTKNFTENKKYNYILDIYVNLSNSGSNLAMLRYNATKIIMYLTENITYDANINSATFLTNVSNLLDLLNTTLINYSNESQKYESYKEVIDEYEFFDEIR